MRAGTGTSIRILIGFALAPNTLLTEIQNVLGTLTKGHPIYDLIDAGVAGVLQIVIDVHELLGAYCRRVIQGALLIAPDYSLYPGVHDPGVVRSPDLIHAKRFGLVSKDPSGVSIVVRHHGSYCGVVDWLRAVPLMSFQGPAHLFIMICTKADDTVPAIIKTHLVKPTGVKCRRLIMDTVMSTIFHYDAAGNIGGCRKSLSGYESQ